MGVCQKRLWVAVCSVFLASAVPGLAWALQVEQLDSRDWHVKSVAIEGNEFFYDSTLLPQVHTRARPWYTPWRDRPVFDPKTFADDLERLRRFYEQQGFFEARIAYDIEAQDVGAGDLLSITFWIDEQAYVTVDRVDVGFQPPQELPLPESLPIAEGERFEEAGYKSGEGELERFFLDHGYAHVKVGRSAKIDAASRKAYVAYVVTPGPQAVFGDTTVQGTERMSPDVILEDVQWTRGERFSLGPIEETRQQLLKRDLFSSVRIGWRGEDKPAVVPMIVEVGEKPHRELKIGVGTATDEHYRVQATWANHDFFGDARELSVTVKYSEIQASAGALFRQPHFLSKNTDGVIELRQDRDDEDNYVLYGTRLFPRLERRFLPTLSGAFGWKLEADKFSQVDEATEAAIGAVKTSLFRFGPAATLVWNTADRPLDPHHGGVVTSAFDVAGAGGDYRFWKIDLEGKKYTELPWRLVLANRVDLAFADAFGGIANLPLSERLYSGGQQSVRGFARRRLGPRSAADDPIGGRTRLEGSVELRRPIWGGLGGAVFFDGGQVSTDAFDVPIDHLKFGTGVAATYATPVGPLRLDVGFPLQRLGGDAPFQIYFSIGQFY